MSAPIKVELFDIGPHNGIGEPAANGSYHAFTLADKGGEGNWPQSLTFMVPAHQLPVRADLYAALSAALEAEKLRSDAMLRYGNEQEARAALQKRNYEG